MTIADVMQAALELTPGERARLADMLYGLDEVDSIEVDAAWAELASHRAEQLETGTVRGLTREEADSYLDDRHRTSHR